MFAKKKIGENSKSLTICWHATNPLHGQNFSYTYTTSENKVPIKTIRDEAITK